MNRDAQIQELLEKVKELKNNPSIDALEKLRDWAFKPYWSLLEGEEVNDISSEAIFLQDIYGDICAQAEMYRLNTKNDSEQVKRKAVKRTANKWIEMIKQQKRNKKLTKFS
jgi:hypothetical protein